MIEATKKTQNEFLNSQLGKKFPVLFENRGEEGFFEGYTPNYTLVKVKSDENLSGKIIDTYLKSVENDYVTGEI